MKRRKIVWLAMLLAVLCIMGISGCGSSGSEGIGKYYCISITQGGKELAVNDEWIELKAKGEAVVGLQKAEYSASWKSSKNGITLNMAGSDYTGTLTEDTLSIEINGLVYTFSTDASKVPVRVPETKAEEPEETEIPETDLPESETIAPETELLESETKEPETDEEIRDSSEDEEEGPGNGDAVTDMETFWNGDWYGWWYMYDTEGYWEEFDGCYWDCCAEITVDADGYGSLFLWDTDLPKDNAAADVNIIVSQDYGSGYMGAAISESGWFLDESVGYNEWVIDPDLYYYDHLVAIEGYYVDTQNGGSFYYAIYLRPWGMLWEDVEADSPEDLPIYYYDWYLPLIEAGKDMPDSIGN